jgi:hypothetical protein
MWSLTRSRLTLLACVAALVALAVPATAAAAGGGGPLTPELTELAKPAVAAQPLPAQDEAIALPTEGPGSLVHEGDRVIVEARFEEGAMARLEALREAGAEVKLASRRFQTVSLSVAPEHLAALAEVPGVTSVTPARAPKVYGAGETISTAAGGTSTLCEGGSVISQGLEQMNIGAAREAFGARGAGETIGVLSDSFDAATKGIDGNPIESTASKDEETGDLPGPRTPCEGQEVPVRVLAEPPAGEGEEFTDEGRAMLQVLHDLVPHAHLAFATAYSTELEFAHNIELLARPVSEGGAGADVIVDDVGYFAEPFFQDGPVAMAVKKVTEEGVTYLSAAGNENMQDTLGRNIGSWEAPEYRPMACPEYLEPILGESSNGCMDFDPTAGKNAAFEMHVKPKGEVVIDMQWAEPRFGVETDLDAYLFDGNGKVLTFWEEGEGDQNSVKDGEPFEIFGWENTSTATKTIKLVINRCAGACNPEATTGTPRLKFEFLSEGASSIEYPESSGGDIVGPTIYGHAGTASAITLGAVRYTESATAPREPETYSSLGPVTHYYGPVVGKTPAAELGSPEVIAKPNVVATDCASTTFFASKKGGAWYFCGTSEAGPHAAAVAALMQQVEPAATPETTVETMEESATPFTVVAAPEAVGAGMLNAKEALTAIGGSLVDDPPSLPKEPSGGGEETPAQPTSPTGGSGAPSQNTGVKKDTAAPKVKISGPKRPVTTSKARALVHFKLTANESPVTFYCEFDRESQRVCGRNLAHRSGPGVHVLKVWAEDASGNVAEAPTTFRFRVKRIRR